jgi:hypothetical protein
VVVGMVEIQVEEWLMVNYHRALIVFVSVAEIKHSAKEF